MMLVVVTQEIEKEPFLINELNEIAPHFSRVIVISTKKDNKATHEYETIVSNNTDYLVSSILYSITKLFSKETLQELLDRKKMRVKPSLKSLIYNWNLTWMIEKRLSKYLAKIWNGEEIILYSYWLNPYAYFVANVKKRNPQITAISRAHGFEIRDFNSYIPFRKTIDSYLDKIIFISDYTQMEYESIMMGIKKKVRAEQSVIRLGVNNSAMPTSKAFNEDSTLNIASCSGIYSLKRLDLIIDSLAEVRETIKLNWIHFGSGTDFEMTLDYARRKLTKNNITFKFKGEVGNLDVLKYYEENQIDIFINTSDYEGIPVAIMEAMSYGIPCIARDIGGNSEIVVDQISGKLVPKDASPTLIAGIIQDFYLRIKNDTQGYLALRFSTYNYWKDNFNAIINYNSFVNYILAKDYKC